MASRRRALSDALVLSEVLSGVQSILNVFGAGISYVNLIFFFAILSPLLLTARAKQTAVVFMCGFCAFVIFKILAQGIGDYALKSLILLSVLPLYIFASSIINLHDIKSSCERFRWFIASVGIVYVFFWVQYGTYRNASTVVLLIMAVLAFRFKLALVFAPIFALVMKTQYKIWLVVATLASTLKRLKPPSILLIGTAFSASISPFF